MCYDLSQHLSMEALWMTLQGGVNTDYEHIMAIELKTFFDNKINPHQSNLFFCIIRIIFKLVISIL